MTLTKEALQQYEKEQEQYEHISGARVVTPTTASVLTFDETHMCITERVVQDDSYYKSLLEKTPKELVDEVVEEFEVKNGGWADSLTVKGVTAEGTKFEVWFQAPTKPRRSFIQWISGTKVDDAQ